MYENRWFYFKLSIVVFLIFGAKLWFIKNFGSSVPFWDEWSVIRGTFLPWMNDELTFHDLFAPHNEHRPVVIRLLLLGEFILNQQWDSLLGMIVNAGFSTLTALFLIVVTRRQLGSHLDNGLLFTIALLWSLPYSWENLAWSFQSAWYLVILFSLLTIWGLLLHKQFTWQWWMGLVSGFLAFLNLISGLLVFIVIAIIKLYLIALDKGNRQSHLTTLVVSFVLAYVCLLFVPESPPEAKMGMSNNVEQFLYALGSNLAWPWVTQPLLSLVLYLPLMVLVSRIIWLRYLPSSAEGWVVAIGGWVILQAVVIAYGRGGNLVYLEGGGPNSRYMDILALGIVVNFLAFNLLTKSQIDKLTKRRLHNYASGWGLLFTWGMFFMMLNSDLGGLHAIKWLSERNVDQLKYTREFLATRNLNVLKDKPFKHIPYRVPEELADLLTNAQILRILPHRLVIPTLFKPTLGSPFVVNGLALGAPPYPQEEVLGSYTHQLGNAATGSFVSSPITVDHEYLEIPVTGYLGELDISLTLVVKEKNLITPIVPAEVPKDRWISCYVRTPQQPFQVIAIDRHPAYWFAFAMPRGVGRFSFWGMQLLNFGKILFWVSMILGWWLVTYRMFGELTHDRPE